MPGIIQKVFKSEAARKSAKESKREERLRQFSIARQAEFQVRSRQKEAQRLLGKQRAQFGAAGVSAFTGTPGVVQLQSLIDTIEETAFIRETAFLDILASRKRQKAFSRQEELAKISTAVSIFGGFAMSGPGGGGSGGAFSF